MSPAVEGTGLALVVLSVPYWNWLVSQIFTSKSLGSSTLINVVRATVEGLKNN